MKESSVKTDGVWRNFAADERGLCNRVTVNQLASTTGCARARRRRVRRANADRRVEVRRQCDPQPCSANERVHQSSVWSSMTPFRQHFVVFDTTVIFSSPLLFPQHLAVFLPVHAGHRAFGFPLHTNTVAHPTGFRMAQQTVVSRCCHIVAMNHHHNTGLRLHAAVDTLEQMQICYHITIMCRLSVHIVNKMVRIAS